MKHLAVVLLFLSLFCGTQEAAFAQRITITIAGNGLAGSDGDNGPAKLARLNSPELVASDPAGNVYFVDGARVRKIDYKTGIISTVAGGGSSTAMGIPATSASLTPTSLCCGPTGMLYITHNYQCVRIVDPATGGINAFAGTGVAGATGDGGPAASATFSAISGITCDYLGNLYIVDNGNHRMRKVDGSTGTVSTVAGTGIGGYSGDGFAATAAHVNNSSFISCNSLGDVFFVDQSNHYIRKITAATGIITNYAGGGAYSSGCLATSVFLGSIGGMCVNAADNVCWDETSCSTREISHVTDSVKYIAGSSYLESFKDDTDSRYAWMNYNMGMSADAKNHLYIADYNNNRIRKIIQLTHSPMFAYGRGQSINACPGYGFHLDSLLAITDLDLYQTETWSLLAAPVHGVVSGLSATASSNGTFKTTKPSGVRYTPDAAYDGNDSFVVRVTDGTASDTFTIYAYVSMPHIGVLHGADSVCVGSSVSLTDTSGHFGTWTSANTLATINSATGVVHAVAMGIDTFTYTLACALTATKIVTINPLPLAGTISGSDTVCVGSTITLAETVAGGVWSSSATYYATVGAATGIVSGVSPGGTNIWYQVTTVHGCISSTTKSLISHASVMPVAGASVICVGYSSTFTEAVPGGTWTVVNANAAVSSSGVVTGVVAGLDTVIYTNSNTCGTASALRPIHVGSATVPSAVSGPYYVCTGSPMTLSGTISGGQWSATNVHAYVGTLDGVIMGITSGLDTVKYVINSGTVCSVTTFFPISVITPPVVGGIVGTTNICIGSPVSFTDALVGGVWSAVNPNVSVSPSGVATGYVVGVDTIVYTVTNVCGTAHASHPVTLAILPLAATISGPTVVCKGSTSIFSSSISTGFWSVSNGNASVTPSGILHGLSVGTDSISYTDTNACGSTTVSQEIVVEDCNLGVGSQATEPSIAMFPNPTNNGLNISYTSLPLGHVSASVVDVTGRNVAKVIFDNINGSSIQHLDLGDVPSGVYMLNIEAGTYRYAHKLVVEK